MKKNKKAIAPNECSLRRWIAAAAVGLILGLILAMPIIALSLVDEQILNRFAISGIPLMAALNMLSFAPLFLSMVLALRWIAKTSLKDFILGVGGAVNKKECLTLMGLQALGLALSFLFSYSNVSWRGVEAGTFAALVVFMLLVTWMQTTFEEMVFRGIFLRWACKNKLGYTKRALVSMVVSSVLFAMMHLQNPEISSMTGVDLLCGFLCYFLPGMVFCWADIHFGSLLPGAVIHWANNFILFTVISGEVSAVSVPTLFVESGEMTGLLLLIGTTIGYAPVMAYILWDGMKRRKAEAQQKA